MENSLVTDRRCVKNWMVQTEFFFLMCLEKIGVCMLNSKAKGQKYFRAENVWDEKKKLLYYDINFSTKYWWESSEGSCCCCMTSRSLLSGEEAAEESGLSSDKDICVWEYAVTN